jgi:DNA-binding phage protein
MKDSMQVFEDIKQELSVMSTDEHKDLAEEAGCHYRTLYNWAMEITLTPRLSTFVKVARAMGYELCLKRARPNLRMVA